MLDSYFLLLCSFEKKLFSITKEDKDQTDFSEITFVTSFIKIYENKTGGYDKRDWIFEVTGAPRNFTVGEIVEQTSFAPATVLNVYDSLIVPQLNLSQSSLYLKFTYFLI